MTNLNRLRRATAPLLALLLTGCGADSPAKKPDAAPVLQTFQARGVVKELQPDGHTIVISHEEIAGYMPAMVMPFTVKGTNELQNIAAGDTVAFQLIVSADDGWIEQVRKLESPPATNAAPALPPSLHIVRDITPLKEGDPLPDYTFTNELGQAVSLGQFKGQALAITFIFTRCPFPTFCPKMSLNFIETQNKLKALTNAPTNWRLLTLSFDPEYDTPAVLKEYAARYGADPARWSFLTGATADIATITEQSGVMFWRENRTEPFSHNLRTIVVDTQGRVQKIIANNNWTADELVAELLRAAAVRP